MVREMEIAKIESTENQHTVSPGATENSLDDLDRQGY